ncbi:MAG TPA: hypothetical protein VID19_05490 [Candidatus Eremiobacteraceae bacterium]
MNANAERFASRDLLYQLAMLRVDELQCEAKRGRASRRDWGVGARSR